MQSIQERFISMKTAHTGKTLLKIAIMLPIVLLLAGCILQTEETPISDLGITQIANNSQEVFEMKLTSSAFENDGKIPDRFTYSLGTQCSGENYSPPLSWNTPPEGTRSLVLTMVDPDGGNWVHWMLFNIPPETISLEEAVGGPTAGVRGRNDFGKLGYGGPCPPSGTHHYIFTLYGLDTTLELEEGASLKAALKLIEGHVLAQSSLTGLRSR
jgi:Raf kinase inhibitor-like YbhB/YbcL family protein